MASRPCRPDPDLKRIWQTLLPGTPFPGCGVPEPTDAAAGETVKAAVKLRDDPASPAHAVPADPAETRRGDTDTGSR
jgi:hypothetical protein